MLSAQASGAEGKAPDGGLPRDQKDRDRCDGKVAAAIRLAAWTFWKATKERDCDRPPAPRRRRRG